MGASATTTTADEAVRLQAEVCRPFPASRRIHVPAGDGVRVPMREITCSPTRTEDGLTPNAPITVYDTSGPYTDPDAAVDLRAGLPPLRAEWIAARGDSEALTGPSSLYGRIRAGDPLTETLRFSAVRPPRRGLRYT